MKMAENDTIINFNKYTNFQEELRNHSVVTPDNSRGTKNMQKKMVRCTYKSMIIKLIKSILFIGLSCAVIFYYAIDMTTKFQNKSSTFTTKTAEADKFQVPPIIICMQNGMKPTVMKKYNLTTIFDFSFGNSVENISSVWDAFLEGSYLMNRDFIMKAMAKTELGMTMTVDLSIGTKIEETNEKKLVEVNVTQHQTFNSGTCYQMKSDISIPPSQMVSIELIFNQSLFELDPPQV